MQRHEIVDRILHFSRDELRRKYKTMWVSAVLLWIPASAFMAIYYDLFWAYTKAFQRDKTLNNDKAYEILKYPIETKFARKTTETLALRYVLSL